LPEDGAFVAAGGGAPSYPPVGGLSIVFAMFALTARGIAAELPRTTEYMPKPAVGITYQT
jgi:hypothetical protein